MILSDRDIRETHSSLGNGHGLIQPWVDEHVQPASIDLTLGDGFIRCGEEWFADEWTMAPGEFLLGTTAETVHIPDYLVGQINGRSSWARKGLLVHTTTGYLDPGFRGTVTLEFANVGHQPIELKLGVRICQVVFTQLTSPAERPYGSPGLGSQYMGQDGVTGSAI